MLPYVLLRDLKNLLIRCQADRGMFYDEETKRFMTTDNVNLHPNPDVAAQPVSNEVDTIMSDAGTSDSDVEIAQYTPSESSVMSDVETTRFTPRTASVAPSESRDDSKMSTRASTPTEVQVDNRPTLPTTPRAIEVEESMEDVSMVDISPGKNQRIEDPSVLRTSDVARWPQGAVLEPELSPPTKPLAQGREPSADKLEEFAGYDSRDEFGTYKP